MAGTTDTFATRPATRLRSFLASRRGLVRDYLAAISGAGGRLVFSLAYFVLLANTLPLSDFGIFATASAAGVVLSRILGFGFISSLYRIATVKPLLIGLFTGGFLMMALISLPVLGAGSAVVYLLFFNGTMTVGAFAMVVAAEALLWRPVEAVIIVNNGLGQFGRASLLAILSTAARAAAALAFMLVSGGSLADWCVYYLVANAAIAFVAFAVFYPRQRIRIHPKLYWRRLPDSLYVACAEVLFYLQMDFDKFVVLSFGGPQLAGIYAVIMRLVDLTAIPIRTFTMMLVQRMMRTPSLLTGWRMRGGIELGILTISSLALGSLALVLYVFPNALGSNVAQAAGLIGLAFLVPGARNIVEYQAELLFARGQTLTRAVNLALLGAAKAVFLIYALSMTRDVESLVWLLNAIFAGLYLISAVLTYSALRLPARRA
ncbi:MAG: lipopolysaccharide biosynthesis protein [Rhizobiaceae bacterium]|nr:lipopolysaccharide biosynthesis protein [Rhizobiaceae bacterium]